MTFRLLCVGVGEGGGRLAQAFEPFGYTTAAINTNKEDLDGLEDIPQSQKLLLKISQGGTGKDPLLVKEKLLDVAHRTVLRNFLEQLIKSQPDPALVYVLLCVGGGGGSGSGLSSTVLDIVLELQVPVGMIYSLPSRDEDVETKKNAISTFQDIYNSKAVNATVSPMILVDNEFMDRQGIPIRDFYKIVNHKVADTVHQFNSFAALPSKYYSAVDTLDFGRLLGLGGVCGFGKLRIVDPTDFNLIKEMMSHDLFVQGVNIQSAKGAAVIIQAPEFILSDQVMSDCINFLFEEVSRIVQGGLVFRGVYEDNTSKEFSVYLAFNGMTYPQNRFNQMWQDIRQGHAAAESKAKRFDEMTYTVPPTVQDSQTFQKVQQPRILGSTKTVVCDNCKLNPITKLRVYNGFGPTYFKFGSCPRCRGTGKLEMGIV
ncbi:hypothetical protein HY496_00145 [Candidatus Woesearchaeota archaeon]|nr:hypothetical protein [Candidatus Woesearchaeota archaeon]